MSPSRTPFGLPPHLADRSRALRIAAALTVVAALAAAGAGWIVRGATETPPAARAGAEIAEAGPVRLIAPGDWQRVGEVPGLTGLDPRSTAAFRPVAALAAYAVVTFGPAADTSLVPASLRPLLPAALPKPRPETLGGARAWRYGELPMAGDRTIEVTVAPTDGGVFAVACVAGREAWVAAVGCSEHLRSVALDRGRWLRPAVDAAARERIPGVVARLDARRVAIRAKLRGARSSGAQRRLGLRLSAAYAAAAAELAPVARTGAPALVVARLRGAAKANRRMAVAAGHRWPKRYRRARRAVARNDAALSRALAALG